MIPIIYFIRAHKNGSTIAIFSELHVDHQELVNDQNLVFDPRSCAKLRKLKVLNTAKNQMLDLQPLDMIPSLSQLDVSGNFLKDLQRTIEIVARIPSLQVPKQDSKSF